MQAITASTTRTVMSLDMSSGATCGEGTEDNNQFPTFASKTNRPSMNTIGVVVAIIFSAVLWNPLLPASSFASPFVFLLLPSNTPVIVLASQTLQVPYDAIAL